MLDRFQLRRKLHEGDTGGLWLAREESTRELVVARIGTGARVAREGEALSRVSHDGLPRLIAHGVGSLGQCLVYEQVEGASLEKVIRVLPTSPNRAVGWTRQIARVVAHLHSAGVVHGDIHPENIIVGRDAVGRDRLVLVGLGAAVLDGRPADDQVPWEAQAGHAVAPELASGEPPTVASDVYALGALLYRLLVSDWPFLGTRDDVLRAHVVTPPPPLGDRQPSLRLPPGLEEVVFRCLAKDPADRYSTADALVAVLTAAEYRPQRDWVRVGGSETAEFAMERQVAPKPPASRRSWVALALAGVAMALWWLLWWRA